MPSTQHTQACVFKKLTMLKLVLFYLQLLQIDEPSEKLGYQIQEQVLWGPSRFSAWAGFGSQDPVMFRVAKTHP